VPAKVVQVTDIPRTKSGKIVELAVRNVVHGLDVRNAEALANPEALEEYRDRPELNGSRRAHREPEKPEPRTTRRARRKIGCGPALPS
jgi:hypothetical protein